MRGVAILRRLSIAAVLGALLLVRPVEARPQSAAAAAAAASTPTWVSKTEQMTVGGLDRTYVVVRPAALVSGKLPVLVVLHGRNMSPAAIEEMTKFQATIGPSIVVYPAGYGDSWNAGACCGDAHEIGADDVSFVKAVVHHVLATQPDASSQDVYLAGYSNGGRMAFRMACEAPSMFAAVASVEAVSVYACPRPKPVSLLEVASRDDPLIAIDGRSPQKMVNGFHEPNVEQLVTDWRQADGCKPSGTTAVAGTLTQTTWTGGKGGTRVAYALYEGGSHMWPRGNADTPSAEQVIWHFFRNKPLPTPNV